MKTFAVLAFAGCLLAAAARAQTVPEESKEDAASWSDALRRSVSAESLESALTSKQASFGADPLVALARERGLDAPSWLKERVRAQGRDAALAALGDSLSAASYSCPGLYCVSNSWSIGDAPTSVRRRLEAQSGRRVRGFIVAVPGVEIDALPAEALAVYLASELGLDIERMTLLIGHNDPGVCRPDKPGEEARFARDVSLALDILERVARKRGARLFIGGLMEADALTRYADVIPQGASASCRELWASTGRCKDLLQRRDEPARLEEARERIVSDDETLRRLSAGRDWIFYSDAFTATSRSGIPDPSRNLSSVDCFHPSAAGQALLSDAAWNGGGGAPGIAGFFAFGDPVAAAPKRAYPEKSFEDGLARALDAWRGEAERP